MGAPAHKKVRSVGTAWPDSATFLARSVRKGVDAMVKVQPSARIRSIALSGSHMSSKTADSCNMMGIIKPYMKPVWCAMGEAMSTMSSALSFKRWA